MGVSPDDHSLLFIMSVAARDVCCIRGNFVGQKQPRGYRVRDNNLGSCGAMLNCPPLIGPEAQSLTADCRHIGDKIGYLQKATTIR